MTNNMNILNGDARVVRFGNAKNAVPFAVGAMLQKRGIDPAKTQFEL